MRVLHLPFPQALMDHHSALLSADPIAQVCSFTCPSCRAAPCSPACRKGKRSALMDHQMKNKEHKQLVAEMEAGLKRVMLVGGVAHRLAGKVAIITGGLSFKQSGSLGGAHCPANGNCCSRGLQLGVGWAPPVAAQIAAAGVCCSLPDPQSYIVLGKIGRPAGAIITLVADQMSCREAAAAAADQSSEPMRHHVQPGTTAFEMVPRTLNILSALDLPAEALQVCEFSTGSCSDSGHGT